MSQAADVSGTWGHRHGSKMFHHQKVRLSVTAGPQAGAHTFVGGFSSALEPGNPFSVLSFPEELTRHSFLEREREREERRALMRGEARVLDTLWTGS